MTKHNRLWTAAAPIALMTAMIVPATTVDAQVAVGRAAAGRTPVKPAPVLTQPRLRKVPPLRGASKTEEDKDKDKDKDEEEEERVRADSAEAKPAATRAAPVSARPVRSRTPRANANVPAATPDTPRIRTRTIPTVIETPPAEPAPPRRRRAGATAVDTSPPPVVSRTPKVPVRTPKVPVRTLPPAVEASPTQDEATPQRRRARTNTGTPAAQRGPATQEEATPRRRRGEATPASDSSGRTAAVPNTPPSVRLPRTARIDDDGGTKIPRTFVGTVKPGAVVLKTGTQGQVISKLPVVRTLSLSEIKAKPVMTLGGTTFNFSPMLDNPKSLPNITNNLLAMPNLVVVHPAKAPMTAFQVKQGVVVNSTLSYTLKPGACSTAMNRAAIAKAGIACFTYRSPASQEAAFADPSAIEYIADPSLRSRAIADARVRRDAVMGDAQAGVTEFRAMLADPAQRAEIEQSLGAAQVARLEALDDTALAGELINMQEVQIEETGFIPTFQPSLPDKAKFDVANLGSSAIDIKLAAAEAQLAPSTQPTNYEIGDTIFLTGFTLGNASEWRKGISTTIRWCLIGCKRTYYVEAWAGFSYAFGMRFPMKLSGTYKFNGNTAELAPTLTMFDGNADDYRKTGLPESKVFNGKEFVAEIKFNAGFAANLPFYPLIAPPEIKLGKDLTELAEFPFPGGNVAPPIPGKPGPQGDIFLHDFDLLQNTANLGIVAIKVHPGIRLTLTSDKMGLTLNGTKFTNETKSIALPMGKGQVSSFKIADPTYNMTFSLTPGLEARVSINLAVWGTNLDWPVWLTAATIEMPPGGIDFTCHEGTKCSRQFTLSPTGAISVFRSELIAWGIDYDARWLKNCFDETCATSVKIKRYDVVEWGLEQESADPDITLASMKDLTDEADKAAIRYNNASLARKSQKSSDTSAAMGLVAIAYYTPQCKDSICVDAVAALADQMGPRAAEITLYQRHLDPTEINKMVNKEFAPKFRDEVVASEMRRNKKNGENMQKQLEQSGGKKPIRRRK